MISFYVELLCKTDQFTLQVAFGRFKIFMVQPVDILVFLFWQVQFRMIVFRPFVGEVIVAKLKESNESGLRCMFNR